MLTTSKQMLVEAAAGGYAVPAINTQGGNYDIIWAICKAAEDLKSPVMLAHYVNTGAYSGHDWFVNVCKWCADRVSVPVAIHLDHGDGFAICMEALKLGFTSLMIDGSTKPVEENARMTNEVLKVAKCFGVPVEAEVGELLRLDNMGTAMENKNIVDPEEVRHFLKLCQPDSLAIGIGFYEAAIIACFLIWFVGAALHRLDGYFMQKSKVVELYVEFGAVDDISGFISRMRAQEIRVTEIDITKSTNSTDSAVAAVMLLRSAVKRDHAEILAMASDVQGVKFVESI